MEKLLLSLVLIAAGMSAGYILQLLCNRRVIRLSIPLATLRKRLQKFVVMFLMPVAFAAAVWITPFTNARIIILPVIAICVFFFGAVAGYLLARIMKKNPSQTGVMVSCGFFANLGSIGSLLCYIFLGEAGFALAVLYRLFEGPLYYSVGYPIAKFYSDHSGAKQTLRQRFIGIARDPLVITIFTALSIGLTLNFSGIERPAFFSLITATFVPCGTVLMLISIGLGMNFSSVTHYLKEGLSISLVKHLLQPLLAFGIGSVAGLSTIENGLALKVTLILSSMPVAFNSLVAASLYDLDLDLANSCWLISTLFLIIVIPTLYFIISSGILG